MTVKGWIGLGLGGVALVVLIASLMSSSGSSEQTFDQAGLPPGQQFNQDAPPPGGSEGGYAQAGYNGQGGAEQALEGLIQIRQQQCQSGNSLACQVLPQMPDYQRQLQQYGQGCQSGDRQACAAYQALGERIFTAYSESAAVMRDGEAAMARMNAWRAQMNANAAASMANLEARGAAGRAAHDARQESYAAMNRSWVEGQARSDRNHGRYVDGIYNGTTMDGGGVQARVDYGSTGYTDGHGNVVAVPNGGRPPDGYTQMNPTYAAPR